MNRRGRKIASLAVAAALITASATYAGASSGGAASAAPPNLAAGKRLYRKYCGQCHALRAALAAGFGSNNGLGTNGGPSFDSLRVPFGLSVLAVKQPFIGHEVLVRKMTWTQIKEVAAFVATATRAHPVLAQLVDG